MKQYVWVLRFHDGYGDSNLGVYSTQAAAEHAREVEEERKESYMYSYWIDRMEVQ